VWSRWRRWRRRVTRRQAPLARRCRAAVRWVPDAETAQGAPAGTRPDRKTGTSRRAATLCRQTRRQRLQAANPRLSAWDADIKVGRQSFAAGQGVNACRLQTPPVGMGCRHKSRAAILCRQTRRQRLLAAVFWADIGQEQVCKKSIADLG